MTKTSAIEEILELSDYSEVAYRRIGFGMETWDITSPDDEDLALDDLLLTLTADLWQEDVAAVSVDLCFCKFHLVWDAENVLRLRSRLDEILNVPRGYASGFLSPAALPRDHFEHPPQSLSQ